MGHGTRLARRARMLASIALVWLGSNSVGASEPVSASLAATRAAIGTVAGTLVDPNGGPVADVELRLSAADEETLARQPSPFDAWPPPHSVARTGATGAFVFEDVPAGNYSLVAGDRWRETWRAPERVSPGSTALRIVFDRVRLRVRVLGDDGRSLEIEHPAQAGWNDGEPLSAEPFFAVVDGGAPDRGPVALQIVGRTADSALFAADPGRACVVGCFTQARGLCEERVEIAAGTWAVDVELHALPAKAQGKLTARMFDPSGEEHPYAFAMELLAPRSRVVLRRAGARLYDVSAFWDPLPAGEYLLRVDDEPRCITSCGRGCESRPARYGAFEGLVRLERDATTTVDARLWAGGRIELDLALDPALREACFERWRAASAQAESEWETTWNSVQLYRAGLENSRARELWSWRALGSRGPAARVTCCELESDAPRELDFFAPGDVLVGAERGVIPGTRATSATLLHPGRYLVRVEHPEFEPVERVVDIAANGVERLRVELSPRR